MKIAKAILALMLVVCGLPLRAQTPAPASTEASKPPAATYRLIYTITEMDGPKRLGVQHFSMTATVGGDSAEMKVGSRVPVATGTYEAHSPLVNTQFQYIDVGLTIRAGLQDASNGLKVFSHVEQSSIGEVSSADTHQPVIRQTNLQNTAILTPLKPVQLGSLDVPGSTHHLDVELSMELVR